MQKFDIYERSFALTIRVCALINTFPKTSSSVVFIKQVIRSSSSIGANLEEADGALTKKDFINRVGISRREARETRHWLKLLKKTCSVLSEKQLKELDWQINETKEILLILSAIINNSKQK